MTNNVLNRDLSNRGTPKRSPARNLRRPNHGRITILTVSQNNAGKPRSPLPVPSLAARLSAIPRPNLPARKEHAPRRIPRRKPDRKVLRPPLLMQRKEPPDKNGKSVKKTS